MRDLGLQVEGKIGGFHFLSEGEFRFCLFLKIKSKILRTVFKDTGSKKMMAVSVKARKSFGFAAVSKQLFQNPCTKKSAVISLSSQLFSVAVPYSCHSRDKNIFGLFKELLFCNYVDFDYRRSSAAFTAIIRMYFAGGIPVRVCKRNEFYLTFF